MAVTYVIDADTGIVMLTATGPTSTEDLVDYQNRLRADPAFRPAYHQLFDFREMKLTDIFSAQVESLLSTSPFSTTSRRAYVVSPGAVYGMARVAEVMAEQRLVLRLFDDIESAREWLLQP